MSSDHYASCPCHLYESSSCLVLDTAMGSGTQHHFVLFVLQDDVPPFPDEEAFAIIQEQLGQPLEALFSSISEQPVAAASLGQV